MGDVAALLELEEEEHEVCVFKRIQGRLAMAVVTLSLAVLVCLLVEVVDHESALTGEEGVDFLFAMFPANTNSFLLNCLRIHLQSVKVCN